MPEFHESFQVTHQNNPYLFIGSRYYFFTNLVILVSLLLTNLAK
jgi:hypothetical protein